MFIFALGGIYKSLFSLNGPKLSTYLFWILTMVVKILSGKMTLPWGFLTVFVKSPRKGQFCWYLNMRYNVVFYLLLEEPSLARMSAMLCAVNLSGPRAPITLGKSVITDSTRIRIKDQGSGRSRVAHKRHRLDLSFMGFRLPRSFHSFCNPMSNTELFMSLAG